MKLSTAIFFGGLISWMVLSQTERRQEQSQRGVLFAAGLITGEALMGILLAMPIAMTAVWPGLGADPLMIFVSPSLGGWPGLAMMILVGALLYRVAVVSLRHPGTSAANSCSSV